MLFEKIALAKIEEAVRNGELDDLPGRGKRIDLNDYFSVPDDLRAAYGVLKNAGVLPQEAQLLKEVRALEAELEKRPDATGRTELRRAIEEKWLHYRLLTERYHGKKRPRR